MKEWLIEVALKKMGPSAVRGAILAFSGWLLAKQGALTSFGIISDRVAQTTTIHWDQLNTAVMVALPALIAAVIKLVNHHADEAAVKLTQKKEDPTPLVG